VVQWWFSGFMVGPARLKSEMIIIGVGSDDLKLF
jgi:hypothetical protein